MSGLQYNMDNDGGIDSIKHKSDYDLQIVNGSYHMGRIKEFLGSANPRGATIFTVIQTSASRNVDALLRNSGLGSGGYFSSGLLKLMHTRLANVLGIYCSFPMVSMGNFDDQNPFFPHTHILGGTQRSDYEFRHAVSELLNPISIKEMIELEMPNNYHTLPLQFLRDNTPNFPVLDIDSRIYTFTREQMIGIANTLMPYSVKRNTFLHNVD